MGGLSAALAVGAGGFLGAIARWLVALWVTSRLGAGWPYGTFLINITGCFAIGFFVTYTSERVAVHEAYRLLFPVGFVGAYTTFSTYELELVRLVQAGAHGRAASYLVLSTLVGYAAVVAAQLLARRV